MRERTDSDRLTPLAVRGRGPGGCAGCTGGRRCGPGPGRCTSAGRSHGFAAVHRSTPTRCALVIWILLAMVPGGAPAGHPDCGDDLEARVGNVCQCPEGSAMGPRDPGGGLLKESTIFLRGHMTAAGKQIRSCCAACNHYRPGTTCKFAFRTGRNDGIIHCNKKYWVSSSLADAHHFNGSSGTYAPIDPADSAYGSNFSYSSGCLEVVNSIDPDSEDMVCTCTDPAENYFLSPQPDLNFNAYSPYAIVGNYDDTLQVCACKPGSKRLTSTSQNGACGPCEAGKYACGPCTSCAGKCAHHTPLPIWDPLLEIGESNFWFGGTDYRTEVTDQIQECSTCQDDNLAYSTTSDKKDCICRRGAYFNWASQVCEFCKAGTFKNVTGNDAPCEDCPKGKYQPMKGEGVCFECPRGTYNSKIRQSGSQCFSCKTCPPNTDSLQANTKKSNCVAKPGYSGPSGLPATACPAGQYKNINGSTECQACAAQISVSQTASIRCQCNLGYYTPSPTISGSACLPCAQGYAANETDLTACHLCPRGTYTSSENSGSTACVSCPEHSYTMRNESRFVGEFGNISVTVFVGGSTRSSECLCNAGYTGIIPNSACIACAPGKFKSTKGTDACQLCAEGKYQALHGQSVCEDCFLYSNSPAGSQNVSTCLCKEGYGLYTRDWADSVWQRDRWEPWVTATRLVWSNCSNSTANGTNSSESANATHSTESACLCPNSPPSYAGEVAPPQFVLSESASLKDCNCANATANAANSSESANATNSSESANATNSSESACLCPNSPPSYIYVLKDCSVSASLEYYNYTYEKNVTGCEICAAGTYRVNSGTGECIQCQANSSSTPGAGACECNYGYVQIAIGGFIQSGGLWMPLASTNGTYDPAPCSLCTLKSDRGPHPLAPDITTTDDVLNCPAGRFWRECTLSGDSGCVKCADNSWSAYGSEGLESCKCNTGFTGPLGGPCTDCPPNFYKNTTGDAPCTICPGITVSPNASNSVVNCTCPRGYEPELSPNASASDQNNPDSYTSDCMCTLGYARVFVNESCTACPTGKYTNVTASTACVTCDIGTYAHVEAMSACILCTPVAVCATGQFWNVCPGFRDGHCMQCTRTGAMPVNASFSGPGWPYYVDACPYRCNSGFESSPAASELSAMQNPVDCVACPVGKYRGKGTEPNCTDCTYPATTRANSSVYCTDCAQGFCFNGFRLDGHADCIKCPSPFTTSQPGRHMRAFTDECRCQPGYDGYSWSCSACRPGSWKSEITETSDFNLFLTDIRDGVTAAGDTCKSCLAGTFTHQWAVTSEDTCQGCNLHSSTHGDTSRCICNVGYYNTDCPSCRPPSTAVAGPQTRCQECPADFYNNETGKASMDDCKRCPDVNSYSRPASDEISDCKCNAGFEGNWSRCTACPVNSYSTIYDEKCVKCPTGTITVAILRSSLGVCLCPADTYGALDISHWTYRGLPHYDWQLNISFPFHCKHCPANSITDVNGDGNPSGIGDPGATQRSQCKCRSGLSGDPANGVLCTSCPPNSFPWVTALYCSCNAGYYDGFSGGNQALFIRTTDQNPPACTHCPPNSHSDNNAIGVEACNCNRGYYGHPRPEDAGNPCFLCPPNSYSTAARPLNVTFCTCNSGFSGDPGATPQIACVECATQKDPNSYTHISTDAEMCTCNTGYYGDLYSQSMGGRCFACPNNTYNNLTSQKLLSACIACPLHSTTVGLSARKAFTDCKCAAGYYHSGEVCVACSPGKYQPSRGAHSCIDCIPNSTSEVASDAATDCKCQAGFYRSGGPSPGGTCMACAAETWKVFVGDAACDPCPSNSSDTPDRTSCVCNAGYYGGPAPELNGGCTACPRDTKQPNTDQRTVSACIPCKRDATALPGSTMCVCKANTYGNGNSDTPGDNCTACPASSLSLADSRLLTDCKCAEGLYGNFTGLAGPGNASCSDCPPNATTTLGAVSRWDCFCPRGYYGNPAATPRMTNPAATPPMMNVTGMTNVTDMTTPAPASVSSPCQLCPPNSTSPAGTTAFSGCVCKADFYGDPAANISCVKCPDNAVSPEGSRQLESCNCKQGFFGKPGTPRTTTPAATTLSTPAPAAAPAATPPMTNVTNFTNVTDITTPPDMTTPAPASASSSLPSTCHACNNCPETHFGAPITNFTLNRPSSVHQWPGTGDQYESLVNPPQFLGTWFRDAVALACRVEFPAGNSVQNKMLWSFGTSTTSTSLRIRDASTTPKLRLLTCNNKPSFQCGNYTSDAVFLNVTSLFDTNAAMIDVIDFPRDGRFHELLALVACPAGGPGPRLALYIDGILKGEAAGVGTCPNGWTATGLGAEYTASSDLVMRYPIVWQNCTGLGRTLSVWGNWSIESSGTTLSSLEAACCTPCPRIGTGPAQTSVGANRNTNASCTCNAGFTGPNGGGPCTACLMGKYKDSKGSQECSACDYGRFTLAQASIVCTNPICKACPSNATSNERSAGLSDCTCQAGFYGNASLGMSCVVCPVGSTGPESASSRADCLCNQGFYGDPGQDITCRACPANSAPRSYVPRPRVIQNCTCNAGYYGSPTLFSNPACQACPSGTYNAIPGLPAFSNCTACPLHSTSPPASPRRGSCVCLKGFFGNLASDGALCQQCPPNTYGPTLGALTQGLCRFCPPNSAVQGGAVAISVFDCTCNQGYSAMFNATHQQCNTCPNFNCTERAQRVEETVHANA